jgi:hypothetical protein
VRWLIGTIILNFNESLSVKKARLQRRQAGFGVLDFGDARVGVLPEVEEAAVVPAGFVLHAFLLIKLPQVVIEPGIDQGIGLCWVGRDQPLVLGDGPVEIALNFICPGPLIPVFGPVDRKTVKTEGLKRLETQGGRFSLDKPALLRLSPRQA